MRVPLNVKARTLPVAISCTTNPKPQTSAVKSSSRIDRGELFFIVFRFLTLQNKKMPLALSPLMVGREPWLHRFPRV